MYVLLGCNTYSLVCTYEMVFSILQHLQLYLLVHQLTENVMKMILDILKLDVQPSLRQ